MQGVVWNEILYWYRPGLEQILLQEWLTKITTLFQKPVQKSNLPRPEKEIADDMAKVSVQAVKEAGISMEQIEWVGIGTPGIANSEKGIIEYSCNLGFNNTPMVEYIKKSIDKPVFIENDANAAAYGEYGCRCGKRR